jgi:lysophospholipase L1-like esterase
LPAEFGFKEQKHMDKTGQLAICTLVLLLVLSACNIPAIGQNSPQPPTVEATVSQPVTESPTTPTAQPETPAVSPKTGPKLPSGALTVVALGDSLTQGDGDESGLNGYPARLQKLIENLRPGTQVLNLGKSGWTSADVLNGVNGEAAVLPQALAANPQIALVWIGSNDLWYLYEYGPEPMTAEAEQQDLTNYTTNIDSILHQLTDSGALVFIALLDDQSKRPVVANPPNPAEPAFSATTPDDLASMSLHISAMNEIIQNKAAKYGAVPVDFFHTEIFTNPVTLYSDGNHPNTAGYEKITQTWFSALEPYLK